MGTQIFTIELTQDELADRGLQVEKLALELSEKRTDIYEAATDNIIVEYFEKRNQDIEKIYWVVSEPEEAALGGYMFTLSCQEDRLLI